jgi:hypothetical protein
MSYITYIVIAALVLGMFYLVKFLNKKAEKSMDENNFKVRQPILFLLVSIMCAILFIGITIYTILFPNDTVEWWTYAIFSFFGIGGLVLAIYCLTWGIKIENEKIVFSPFIGIKRNYTVSNITKVKLFANKKIEAYAGKNKLFSVEPTAKGYNVLVSRLKKEQIAFDVELNRLSL